MANIVKDRVLEFTNVTGFDPIQLNGSPIGYRGFGDVLSDGDECYYTLVSENGDWETGISVYDANLNTLDRGTVTDNSVGSNAQIPFQTDSKKVFLTFTAQAYKDLLNEHNTFVKTSQVVQSIGNSVTNVMSQNAVTNEIDSIINSKAYVSVKEYGAKGDGVTDDTSAIQDAIDNEDVLFWPEGDYIVSGNIANFRGTTHLGRGVIVYGQNSFYVGDAWQAGVKNTIFVSNTASLTNDGMSENNPISLSDAFLFLREIATISPGTKYKIVLAAGTYTEVNTGNIRLEQVPSTTYPIEIIGTVDGGGLPTTIFDGYSSNVFRKLEQGPALNLTFKNLKFQNSSAGAINIYAQGNINLDNIHAENISDTAFNFRWGTVYFLSGYISNCNSGISFQDVYGSCGAAKGSGLVELFFEDILGVAISYSRGTDGYVVGGDFTNVGIGIEASRFARVRTQNCKFNSWNVSAIQATSGGYVESENISGEPDTFDIDGVNTQIMFLDGMSGYNRISLAIPSLKAHKISSEEISVNMTTSPVEVPLLSPFSMPRWWLSSQTAKGIVEYYVQCPTGGITRLLIRTHDGNVDIANIQIDLRSTAAGSVRRGKITLEILPRLNGGSGVTSNLLSLWEIDVQSADIARSSNTITTPSSWRQVGVNSGQFFTMKCFVYGDSVASGKDVLIYRTESFVQL